MSVNTSGRLAVDVLFDGVVAQFEADRTNVPNLFGWKKPAEQIVNGNRVIWVPGDDGSNVGQILPPKSPASDGVRPRWLATLEELFTIVIVASDPAHLEDERAQYRAVRYLYDAWFRAAHLTLHANFRIVSNKWNTSKKVLPHGAELRTVIAVRSMIPDTVPAVLPVDAVAVIDVHQLDLTETITAPIPEETTP